VLAVITAQAAFLAEGVWTRLRPWSGWRWVAQAGAVLFVAALPVALVSVNLRVLFTNERLYTFAVEQYDVPAITGIPRPEIDRAMAEIRDYFTNNQRLLRITVTDEAGHTNPLFTPREVIHMRDVKDLVRGIFFLGALAGVYTVGYAAVRLAVQRRAALAGLARLTRMSMLASLGVALGFGGATLLGFDRLFEEFHVLSFSNDLWQLDPAQDHLVQMFPFDFWLVATVLLVGITIVEVLALLSLAWWYVQQSENAPPFPPAPSPPAERGKAV
jgi:integral membrane protein (TIGR01906 family)